MIGDERSNLHRRIIFAPIAAVHVALLLGGSHAQPTTAPPLTPSSNATKADPSRAIVFAVLLSLFFFIGFLSIYLRECSGSDSRSAARYLSRTNAYWPRRNGLDDAVVESFPVFSYSSVKDWKIGSGALECAVCLSEFQENEELRLIPRCNHVFHIDCIDAWLYSHSTCPVCRAELGEDDPPVVAVTESIGPESNRGRDHIAIDIDGDRAGDSEAIEREKRLRQGISGKLPRSNSTGHSLARLGDSTERHTLRLPEEVRKRIMEDAAASGRRLKRTRSYDCVFAAAEGSTRRDRRSGGEGSSSRGRGHRVTRTNRLGLFVSKMDAVKPPSDNGEGIVRARHDSPIK